MIKYIEDCILAFIQNRCDHPGNMVAVDILEGCVDHLKVSYCRRCGSIKTDWSPHDPKHQFIILEHYWRQPDPHMWRDSKPLRLRFTNDWLKAKIETDPDSAP